jgi:hypothetical protein
MKEVTIRYKKIFKIKKFELKFGKNYIKFKPIEKHSIYFQKERFRVTTKEVEYSFKEIRELFKETEARFKETDARLDKSFKETDQKIKKLAELFTGQWGKLIESLAESGILELLQKRGIKITELYRNVRSRRNGQHTELDFLLTNENELVVGEVKTTLKAQDVTDFLKKLQDFFSFFPKYKGNKVYGAIIGIRVEENADRFAYKNGLFVFKVGGEGTLRILNDAKFKPHDFGAIDSDSQPK